MSEQIAWAELRKLAPVREPVSILCDDGVRRWICPPRNADGCEQARESYSVVRTGYHGPHHLYPQERYVLSMERREALRKAATDLDLSNQLFERRPGLSEFNLHPWPEDFGMPATGFEQAVATQ